MSAHDTRPTAELLWNTPAERIARARLQRAIAYRLLEEADRDEEAARIEDAANRELSRDALEARRTAKRFGGGELRAFVETRR